MSIIYCDKHDRKWDSDKLDICPVCETEPEETTSELERELAAGKRALADDAVVMALVKELGLCIQPPHFDKKNGWHVWKEPKPNFTEFGHDLNLTIRRCAERVKRGRDV